MLNMTKVKLELIPDSDMYIFFEKGTRGGVSYISNRYSKANNKYLKFYNPKQEWKYIIYLDTNNLYGYMQYLNFFQQAASKEFELSNYTSNSSKGCVLEVELWLSFGSSKIETKREILPEYQLKIADLYNIPIDNVKKLVSYFFDKEKHVIHYKNLQLYLLWLKLKKYILYYNSINLND